MPPSSLGDALGWYDADLRSWEFGVSATPVADLAARSGGFRCRSLVDFAIHCCFIGLRWLER